MKCAQCGTKNDPESKFCKGCGAGLQNGAKSQPLTAISELYGKEVEVLFFIENFTGKISGIVNPSEDQIGRYREGILQRITIKSPYGTEVDANIGDVLTFIRQTKEYLGEPFKESEYRKFNAVDLKKEYLRLFDRILKQKSLTPLPKPAPTENKQG